MKKKIDARIRTLIENGVKTHRRSFFVIVGDKSKEQVVNLHYMLSKASVKARPSVLWCYKKDLGFSSNRQKRVREIKKMVQRGVMDPEKDDPFDLFISSTEIRYCYYPETDKVLGNTFGMCVLQDFEAITPNIMARTIETVEGGGVVVLLLRSVSSLQQLFAMSMDVHSRFRTEAHQDVAARFNERFILSLGSCRDCLVVDDELNILPLSSHARSIVPISHASLSSEDGSSAAPSASVRDADRPETSEEKELRELKLSLKDTQPVGPLANCTRTLDQARAVLTFVEAISEKSLRSTVALTAGRGRGKSAALGLAIAAAVAYGYSNIFVTSPSPENLRTLFEFVFKGFDALDMQEHLDYELVQSTNPDFHKAVVRVNIFKTHRQTIQYIQPQDAATKLGQAELVVIDEAAAIPLPIVKSLLGPYLVFMASTINGYEGTGRSLSLKLIQQLRDQSNSYAAKESAAAASADGAAASSSSAADAAASAASTGSRLLREIQLDEPIRYAKGDQIEKWLNDLLCLDAANHITRLSAGCPHPSECDLYYVNRDTLFSYHKASESFLQRMMALYVSSHYKNSPNDLQLMADAPAHHLFVLLGPVDPNQSALPEVLCVIQVCMEGEIGKSKMDSDASRGIRPSGDLIPYTVSQQYQDNSFGGLAGARVVRIATHPDYMKMGYGSRALELLSAYYSGQITSLDEPGKKSAKEEKKAAATADASSSSGLQSEVLKPRKNLPPLLCKLKDRVPEKLNYLGVSFGLTQNLFKFWKRGGYSPVYLRLTPNELTGEHTCIMLKYLASAGLSVISSDDWLQSYNTDFKRRFASLLGFDFRSFAPGLALSLLEPKTQEGEASSKVQIAAKDARLVLNELTTYDLKRLDSYSRNLIDYHVILDMIPTLARLYFTRRLPVDLSYAQASVLIFMGLQHRSLEELQSELGLQINQINALFTKTMRRIHAVVKQLEEKNVEYELDQEEEQSQKKESKSKGKKAAQIEEIVEEEVEEPQAEEEEMADEEGESAANMDDEEEEEEEEHVSAKKAAKIEKQREELLRVLGADKEYAVGGSDADWEQAVSKAGSNPHSVSVKVAKKRGREELKAKEARQILDKFDLHSSQNTHNLQKSSGNKTRKIKK